MIIERYLMREIIGSFAAVVAVLVMIFLSNRFVRALAQAADGQISSEAVLELIGLKLVNSVGLIIPLAFFLAVLLALGRLYSDSEMTAMHAGGVGVGRVLRAVVALALAAAVGVAGFSMLAAPRAEIIAKELVVQSEQGADMAGVFAGRFKVFDDGRKVFYARDISDDYQVMHDIFVELREASDTITFAAPRGYQHVDADTGDRFLVLNDGVRYRGTPGAADYVVTRFATHAVRIKDSTVAPERVPKSAVPTAELLRVYDARYAAEFHWRLAMPVSLLVLAVLAVLLARTTPRQGKFARIFMAVMLYVVYSNLLGIGRELVEDEQISKQLGLWPVHGLLLLYAIGLLVYDGRLRWWLAARRARRAAMAVA